MALPLVLGQVIDPSFWVGIGQWVPSCVVVSFWPRLLHWDWLLVLASELGLVSSMLPVWGPAVGVASALRQAFGPTSCFVVGLWPFFSPLQPKKLWFLNWFHSSLVQFRGLRSQNWNQGT